MKHFFLSFTLPVILFLLAPSAVLAQESSTSDADQNRAMGYFIDGVTHFENGEFELALDKLTAAHLILSDDAGINYALSDVYLTMGDLSNAAYYGQIAVDSDPENRWYRLNLAEIYRHSGQYEQSINALKAILDIAPGDVDVLFLLAESYLETGRLEDSNQVLDQILTIRGSIFEVHLRKFQNYNALRDRDSALNELEKMRDLNPGNLSTLHTISQYYMEMGDSEAAREVLIEARDRNPRDPKTQILLAEIYINENEWEKLGNTFITIIEDPLVPASQKMEIVRFMYLQQQSMPQEEVLRAQTEKVILAISEHESDFGPAQLVAADYYMQQNNPEAALETLERVNELLPSEADAWSQRMQILFQLGRYDEVIALSDEANDRAPDNAFIQFFTGAAYMFSDDNEQAEMWLESASMSPSQRNFRSIIYGTLGDVRHDLGKWDETVDAFTMALRLDANNHTALNNYAYYLSLRSEKLDEALEMSERAVSMDPNNAAYLDTIGWIHFKKGNYEKAREYIQQSVDTGDASAEVYEHLGDVYEAISDLENARKWWKKAFEMDPDRTYLQERI
ncbi:MAG: tetratricopeptide repeat protein [Balneolaceae bacterium]|nr:MAG: tetratricopeptide repeat protein [Balneolaceae bacterium]